MVKRFGILVAVAGVLAAACFPVLADRDDGPATEPGQDPGGDGLVVENVVWEPAAGGGGTVSVRFKLVGVEELPKHPSISYVVDEQSGETLRLQSPIMLPPTSDDPAEARSATMVLPDERGLIRPGSEVTVVVAGLIRKGIPVEGDASAVAVAQAAPEMENEAELEVVKLLLSGGGGLLDVRYRLSGLDRVRADEGDSYIEIPDSGEKFYVLGVARIGTLATKDAGADRTSYALFKVTGNRVKAGDRVTVVIAGVRQENVLVEE